MKSIKLRSICAAVSGALLMGVGVNAMADTTDDILQALIAKGVLTEEEGALISRGRTGEKEAAEEKKKSAVTAKYKDGIVFESGDGNFSTAINGRVHADYRTFDYSDGVNTAPPGVTNSIANVTNIPDTFDIRRARIGMKAKFKEYYEAEVVADLGGTANTASTSTTLDVGYLNIAWWKPVQFRFGQFKMPMNLEELTSSNNIDFMERSFVNQLAPAKEIGAMVHGLPYTGVTYALALSNGAGQKQGESDMREADKDIIGRVTANFAEMMGNKDMVLHTGISYSTGDVPQGTVGVSGRTEARGATFFRAPVLANTPFKSVDRSRVGLEGALAYNQFKFQTEWMQMNNDFSTNTRSYDLDTQNWYAQALWLITGEKYADNYKNGIFGAIKPKSDFNPATFSGGAWELGVRFSKFDASDYNAIGVGQGVGTDAAITTKAAGFSEAKAYTVGVKFYPNSNLRFMLNYVNTDFDSVIGGATGGILVNNKRVDDEKALIMRAQWMF